LKVDEGVDNDEVRVADDATRDSVELDLAVEDIMLFSQFP
jgi:hypothetical protein